MAKGKGIGRHGSDGTRSAPGMFPGRGPRHTGRLPGGNLFRLGQIRIGCKPVAAGFCRGCAGPEMAWRPFHRGMPVRAWPSGGFHCLFRLSNALHADTHRVYPCPGSMRPGETRSRPAFSGMGLRLRVAVKNTGGKLEPLTLEPRLPRVRGKYVAGGFGPHETRAAFRVAVKIRSDRATGGAFHP